MKKMTYDEKLHNTKNGDVFVGTVESAAKIVTDFIFQGKIVKCYSNGNGYIIEFRSKT